MRLNLLLPLTLLATYSYGAGNNSSVQVDDSTGIVLAPAVVAGRTIGGGVSNLPPGLSLTNVSLVNSTISGTLTGTVPLSSLPAAVVTNNAAGQIPAFALLTNTTTQEYNVEAWGAIHNGIIANTNSVAAGSIYFTNNSPIPFTASDVGKYISISYAGSNFSYTTIDGRILTGYANHSTTIATYISPTLVTLTAPAVSGSTNYPATYGTDDSSALKAAIAYVGSISGASLYCPSGIYCIAAPITDPGSIITHTNSQLYLPSVKNTGANGHSFTIIGETSPACMQLSTASNPKLNSDGTIWMSMLADGAGGALLSGANFNTPVWTPGGAVPTNNFNGVRLNIRNIEMRVPMNPKMDGINAYSISDLDCENVFVDTGCQEYSAQVPAYTNFCGIRTPGVQNAGQVYGIHDYVEGFGCGVGIYEHAEFYGLCAFNCVYAIGSTNGNEHNSNIRDSDFENVSWVAYLNNPAILQMNVNIECTIETGSGGTAATTNTMMGLVNCATGGACGSMVYEFVHSPWYALTNNDPSGHFSVLDVSAQTAPVWETPIKTTQSITSQNINLSPNGTGPGLRLTQSTNAASLNAATYVEIDPCNTGSYGNGDNWAICAGYSGFLEQNALYFRDQNNGILPLILMSTGNATISGILTATSGVGSTATNANQGFHSSAVGCTNTLSIGQMFDVATTTAKVVFFNSAGTPIGTNASFTITDDHFYLQPGGFWTNSGTVTINWNSAFP